MIHLESFRLPSDETEQGCWDPVGGKLLVEFSDTENKYPFSLYRYKKPANDTFLFSDITIFYGGNGSGKSTLINLIATKLGIPRKRLFNSSPTFEYYIEHCMVCPDPTVYTSERERLQSPIRGGCVISSDDVFDEIIGHREREVSYENERQNMRGYIKWLRREKFEDPGNRVNVNFETGEGMDSLIKHREMVEAQGETIRKFLRRRIDEVSTRSNGENAFDYFVNTITPGTLALLDEPENSMSAKWQSELALFLRGCATSDRCQLIISTHSPVMLSIPGAKIYNLDAEPISTNRWNELENVRCYFKLFEANKHLFRLSLLPR